MLDLFQQFMLPLFFKTDEKNKLVNKLTLYVIKEVATYIEDEEGRIKKEINRVESPKTMIYEGKLTLNPHIMREILSDPLGYPQNDPNAFEKAISFEQKDMISTVYDMVQSTLEGFNMSSRILMNSLGVFFGKQF